MKLQFSAWRATTQDTFLYEFIFAIIGFCLTDLYNYLFLYIYPFKIYNLILVLALIAWFLLRLLYLWYVMKHGMKASAVITDYWLKHRRAKINIIYHYEGKEYFRKIDVVATKRIQQLGLGDPVDISISKKNPKKAYLELIYSK